MIVILPINYYPCLQDASTKILEKNYLARMFLEVMDVLFPESCVYSWDVPTIFLP